MDHFEEELNKDSPCEMGRVPQREKPELISCRQIKSRSRSCCWRALT